MYNSLFILIVFTTRKTRFYFQDGFISIDGEEIELNLYGDGKKEGKDIVILDEAKSRIYEREVRKFIHDVSKVLPVVKGKGEVVKVMFGYLVHPSATKQGEAHDVIIVASYQR